MSGHRWLDDVPGYVLGALDADASAAFESHLETCDECRSKVAELALVGDALATAIPPRTPPSGLKARILSEARADERATGDAGATEPDDPDVVPIRPGERPRSLSILPWLAAAAGAVLAAASLLSTWQERQERERLVAEVADARARIATLEQDLGRRDSLLALLSGARVETATLARTSGEPRIRLVWNRDRASVLIAAFDLPPAPAGRTYQLWGIPDGGRPISLGTFDTDADGTVLAVRAIDVEGPLGLGAVTEEPAGGSPQPTSQPFLVGPWSGASQ